MATLTAFQAPVAIDSNFIAQKTENLKVAKDVMSKNWTVTLDSGALLFRIEGEFMSLSHRMTVKDSKGQKMYQIRHESISGPGSTLYYAEVSEGGPKVWEMEITSHMFIGTETTMRFFNVANGGKEDQLEFKNNPMGSTGYVKYQGKEVAKVHRNKLQLGTKYDLEVMQGLDLSLIVGIVVAMHDKIETRNSAAASGGSGGGGGC
jgi:uncharacterized protein YxjI